MNYCLPRMALVGLAFAAVAAAEAQVRVQDRMVIVTEAPLSKEQGDLIKTLPRAELLEQFEALGFQKHLETGRTFLFSKKLWAEETLNALTGLYEGLAAHQTGKFLDISKSPQVAAFVRASFGSVMRFESPQSAQFMLGRVGDLLLTDGTRSVLVTMTPEVDDAEAKELSTKPLKQQSGSPPADAADPSAVYQLPLAGELHARSVGPDAADPRIRMEDLALATKVLTDRYSEAYSRALAARNRLIKLATVGVSPDVFASVEKGMSSQSLPPELRQFASDYLASNWQRFGFESDDAAAAYFGKATVRWSQVSLALIASRGDGPYKNLAMFGLPRF